MRTFGMISSPLDPRDYTLDKAVAYSATPLRDMQISAVPDPVDQGSFGVCAAVTLAGVLEMIEYKQRAVPHKLSIKYLYGNRAPGDYQGEGMMPRELLQMATRFGTPRMELLPGLSNYPAAKQSITPALDGEGLPNRPKAYVRLRVIQDIFDYMTLFDLPVFFGMWVTNSFMGTTRTGIVAPPSGQSLGGHAMRCIGIRNINGRWHLVIQNSWGTAWGDGGLCYICLDDGHKGVESWGLIPEDTASLIQRPQVMMLRLGSDKLYVDDKLVTMDVAPFAKDNRTWVPLRFVAEQLGMKVEWYPDANGDRIILRDGGELSSLG